MRRIGEPEHSRALNRPRGDEGQDIQYTRHIQYARHIQCTRRTQWRYTAVTPVVRGRRGANSPRPGPYPRTDTASATPAGGRTAATTGPHACVLVTVRPGTARPRAASKLRVPHTRRGLRAGEHSHSTGGRVIPLYEREALVVSAL
ncbi:hypothetical protein GCM10027091_59170 [Streptomyces daliensis]